MLRIKKELISIHFIIVKIFLIFFVISCKNFSQPSKQDSKEYNQILNLQSKKDIMPIVENWWDQGVIYQIWPRAFSNFQSNGHGHLVGIIEKLDYLKYLGINAIWINPIFQSPSLHGYDATDFFAIHPDLGNLDDFKSLVLACHQRGIKIILDIPINHISSEHRYFKMSENKIPPYDDFFIWSKDYPQKKWKLPWQDNLWHYSKIRNEYYYAVFSSTMPDVNFKNNLTLDWFNNIFEYWLNLGVDGFRLDAIRYIVEEDASQLEDTPSTMGILEKFSQNIKKINPQAYIVGESWTSNSINTKYFGQGKGIDGVFDFSLRDILTSYLKNSNLKGVDLYQTLLANTNLRRPFFFFSSFLNNHDLKRLDNTNLQKLKMLASILFMHEGNIFIYYGEEIGMGQVDNDNDLFKRAPMQWQHNNDQNSHLSWHEKNLPLYKKFIDEEKSSNRFVDLQKGDEDSLLELYRILISMKTQRKEFSLKGSFSMSYNNEMDVMTIKREFENKFTTLIVNLSSQTYDYENIIKFSDLSNSIITYPFGVVRRENLKLVPHGIAIFHNH